MPRRCRPRGFPQRAAPTTHAHARPADAADALPAAAGRRRPPADLRLSGAPPGGAGRHARARGARQRRRPLLQPFIDCGAGTGGRGLRRHRHQLRLPGALAARTAGRAAGAGVELGAAAAGRTAGAGPALRRHHHRGGLAGRRRIFGASAPTRPRRSKASRPARRCTARCCRTCRRWTQADAQAAGAGRGAAAAARAIPTSTRWCWSAPTCRPMPPALRAATGLPVLDIVTLLNARMAALGRQCRAAP